MKPIISLLLSCLLVTCLSAQPGNTIVTKKTVKGKAKKYYEEGRKLSFSGKLNDALKVFNKALEEEPNFIDVQLQVAGIYYEQKAYEKAEAGFEKVITLAPDYNKKVWYSLAFAEMKQDKFDEAVEHFKQFINQKPRSASLVEKAQKYVDDLSFLAEAMQNPVPFVPESLGNLINTEEAEYLPAITADGNTMIYTKLTRGQEDFYVSQFIDGQWQEGKPITSLNRPRENEGAQSISADGKYIVFTVCNSREGLGSCDLFFSELDKGEWSKPANVGHPVSSRAWESQPSISPDRRFLFFSSNRKEGSQGGKDLWVSERNKKGQWGVPTNLGPTINTERDEQAPFIHADGQTLYFMSNGHPGVGGHDLFFSRRQEDGSWGKPQNLGYPINTPANEGALIVSLDGKTAYFASDAKDPAAGASAFDDPNSKKADTDLYQFELYEAARPQAVTYVQAKVIDAKTRRPLVAKTDFIILPENKAHLEGSTDKAGEFLVCLPAGKDYALNVNKEGYLFHSENFALSNKNTLKDPFLLEIELQPIPEAASDDKPIASKPVILKNVFFDTGSSELRPASFVELDRLKQLLEENPGMKIQISGHTDNVGEDEANLTLSDNRANAVLNYLVTNGIAQSRLSAKGYGELQPIDDNETDEGRQNNRRTEFVIVN